MMIWVARADGDLDFFNKRCYEYSGLSYRDLAGWSWRNVIHPEDWERCLATWTRALQSGEPYEVQYRLRRADGMFRWHHGSALPVRDADGKVVRWFGTCTDVEDQVRDVRRLMDRVVSAQESERRRLAEDLHDLIGQNLTALGIDLTALKQRLEASGAADGARIDVMRGLVEKTIDAIRGVMTDLRPPELEEFGLAPALRWYAAEFSERTGLKAGVAWPGERRLPREIELALFRIAQEALTNVAKHAAASRVTIALAADAGRVRLVVEDDGCGIAATRAANDPGSAGWGMAVMRERAVAAGGTMQVESAGRGTRIVVELAS
jgi:two-component system sensor histidine kinase UhpB